MQVTAKWGWPSVPDDINMACLILTADLYKRKDAPGGILGLGDLGVVRMSPIGRGHYLLILKINLRYPYQQRLQM